MGGSGALAHTASSQSRARSPLRASIPAGEASGTRGSGANPVASIRPANVEPPGLLIGEIATPDNAEANTALPTRMSAVPLDGGDGGGFGCQFAEPRKPTPQRRVR